MKRSHFFLGFLWFIASSGVIAGATDKQDLVLTRQELRHQVYLYNGWMADVVGSRENSEVTAGDPLPLDRVMPALLGQLEERTLSLEDLAAQRERLTRWIGLLAATKQFRGGGPSPVVSDSKLPAASVALHFRRPKPGSSLARDFRDESDAYARLRRLAESVLSESRAVQKAFEEANPELKNWEKTRRFESSKEIAAWLSKVQGTLDALDRECVGIGYPVSTAWAIREQIKSIRKGVKAVEGKVELKPSAPQVPSKTPPMIHFLEEPPVTVVDTSLEKLVKTSGKAGGLCRALSEAYADPPGGIDAVILELAWSSIVPLTDPDPERLVKRLEQAASWINAVGLKKDLRFGSLNVVEPAGMQLNFGVTESLWRSTNSQISEIPIGFDGRLFYKFTGAIGATPAAVAMTIYKDGAVRSYSWHNGLFWVSVEQDTSATVGGRIEKEDLAKILSKVASAGSESDSVATLLSRNVRNFLVKYLASFQGKVAVIHDEPTYLLLRVTNAKNLVLATENLWEDLDINFIIAAQEQGAKLICIVDGRWAPGILAPKSVEAFRDMEPQYSKNLSDFAGQLLVRMKDNLLKQDGDAKPK